MKFTATALIASFCAGVLAAPAPTSNGLAIRVPHGGVDHADVKGKRDDAGTEDTDTPYIIVVGWDKAKRAIEDLQLQKRDDAGTEDTDTPYIIVVGWDKAKRTIEALKN